MNLPKLDSLAERDHKDELEDHAARKRPQRNHDGLLTSVMIVNGRKSWTKAGASPILADFEKRVKCDGASKAKLLCSLHSREPP